MSDDKFNWGPENEDVVVPEQKALAIYANPWGQVVIRQEAAWDESEDRFLVISWENLPKVIEQLTKIRDDNPGRADPDELKRLEDERQKAKSERRALPSY